MPIIVLAVLGLAAIVVGILSSRAAGRRATADPSFARPLRYARVVGIVLALACWPLTGAMGYPYGGTPEKSGKIAGVPFMVAYFDEKGFDYIGPTAIIGLAGNSAFWFYVPTMVLMAVTRLREPKRSPE